MNENFDKIAISSRIRLARNFSGHNFFAKLRDEYDALSIINSVSSALKKFGDFDIIRLKNLSVNECNALLERHLISKELIENKDISAVAFSEDEQFVIMINEEDHIREQCIVDGFNLFKPYREIKKLDNLILSEMDVAYSVDYGFLTSSPANLGTGMRASVLLFLPAIERNKDINIIKNEARSLGFTLRGLYGEGTKNTGGFYQISNQNSLGLSESEIIDKVSEYVFSICGLENSAREDILSCDHDELVDEIYRAYGILTNARLLSEEDLLKYFSLVKFGDALGFLKIYNEKEFDRLLINASSANLKEIENLSSNLKEDARRAEYINKQIFELVSKV